MTKEVNQPINIEIPQGSRGEFLDVLPKIHVDWAREVVPQLGLDPEKYIIGIVFHGLTGDDGNIFYASTSWMADVGYFIPKLANKSKERYKRRYSGYIDIPELPEAIRERVLETNNALDDLNWEEEEGFGAALRIWTNNIRDWSRIEVRNNPEIIRAVKYYELVSSFEVLSVAWDTFYEENCPPHKSSLNEF